MGDTDKRTVNVKDMEQLAKLLDGTGGLHEKLEEAFTRAGSLGVTDKLSPLKPSREWTTKSASEVRRKAALVRLDSGDPLAGLLYAGFTPEQLKGKDLPPDVLLLANATAANEDRWDTGWLSRKDGESLDDWIVRIQGDGVGRLTNNQAFGDAYAQYIETVADAGAFFRALKTVGMGSRSLHQYFKNSKLLNAPGTLTSRLINGHWDDLSRIPRVGGLFSRVPNGLLTALAGSDEAAVLGGYMRNGAFYLPTATEANLLTVANRGGFAAAAKTAGWFRGLGVVGSAGATAWGVANLATMDHGKEIKEDPWGYASAWAGTGFNASLTAAMIAPNPVTVGLAIGTGIVYGTTLAFEHRKEIGEAFSDAKEWTGDKIDDAGDALKDGADAVGDFLFG